MMGECGGDVWGGWTYRGWRDEGARVRFLRVRSATSELKQEIGLPDSMEGEERENVESDAVINRGAALARDPRVQRSVLESLVAAQPVVAEPSFSVQKSNLSFMNQRGDSYAIAAASARWRDDTDLSPPNYGRVAEKRFCALDSPIDFCTGPSRTRPRACGARSRSSSASWDGSSRSAQTRRRKRPSRRWASRLY